MAKKVRFDVVQAWSQDGNASATKPETHLNYFTCTLGGAARWNKENTHPFQTVNDLIDAQAQELRQRPALNFAGGCHAEDGKEMKSGMSQWCHFIRSHADTGLRLHLSRTPQLFIGNCSEASQAVASCEPCGNRDGWPALFQQHRIHSNMARPHAVGSICDATCVSLPSYLFSG